MTRLQILIQSEPTATPVVNQTVRVRRDSDGVTLATPATDADGFVSWQADANPGPATFTVEDLPGGVRYSSQHDAAGPPTAHFLDLPVPMRLLDGVIRDYGNALAVSAGVGNTVVIATGCVVAAGHPIVNYTANLPLTFTRPVSVARLDRVIVRVTLATGAASFVYLAGTEGAVVPALTQTSTTWELSLAQVSVPVVGPVTITDERLFSREGKVASGEVRSTLVSTTSAGGEALSGLSLSLVLPQSGTYDVFADLSAVQDSGGGWLLQDTIGAFGSGTSPNFNTPQQVAVDSSGNVYVADYGNGRIVKLDSSGAYVTSGGSGGADQTGVAVDSSGNIYSAVRGGVGIYGILKANASFVQQWFTSTGGSSSRPRHIATDGTYVYATRAGLNWVSKYLASTGALVASYSFAAGPLNGIATDGTYVYVSDSTVNFVRKRNASDLGVVTEWGSSGSGDGQFSTPAGIAIDASGDVWVCDSGNNRLQRFSSTGAFQVSISQFAPISVAVASGDVLWASNSSSHNVAKWDEAPAGYGQIAVEIDSSVSDYLGIGDRDGAVANVSTGSKAGPATVTVRGFGKATSGTAVFQTLVLSARAEPRR